MPPHLLAPTKYQFFHPLGLALWAAVKPSTWEVFSLPHSHPLGKVSLCTCCKVLSQADIIQTQPNIKRCMVILIHGHNPGSA